MRWPKISWKKTPAARPERMAGPTNGSAGGACSRSVRFLPARSTAARTCASLGSVDGSRCFEAFHGSEIHSVGGLAAGGNDEAGEKASRFDAGSVGIDHGGHDALRLDGDVGVNGSRILGHLRGNFAQARRPFGGVEFQLGRRGKVRLRLFGREIVGTVGGGGTKFFIGLEADQLLGGAAIDSIRGQPDGAANGVGVIVQGEARGERESRMSSSNAPVVIELGRSGADGDIENPVAIIVLAVDGAAAGENDVLFLIRDLVAEKVWSWIGFLLESGEVPFEFVGEDLNERRLRLGTGRE